MLRALIVVVVALLVVTGLGFGYFRYQWGKVASAPCPSCVAAANGQPYNLLLIGSDSRSGETAAEAQQFGSPTAAAGQRSDTIKILHVDPANGTASSLSIPRDTYVTITGLPANSQLSAQNKINAAFSNGPDALVQTIENTFGIPISHYIVINFFGVEDAVNALGGISMDFPYPVRDQDCSTGTCYNNSGLDIPTTGCQVLNGSQALALSRSRYFEYEVDGSWRSDPTSDIGRIERQNLIIEAAIDKAKSTYNPLSLNALLSSVVHDFSKDNGLSAADLFSLAERYHAFSGSQLQNFTLPTVGATSAVGRLGRGRRARGRGNHHHPMARWAVRFDPDPADRRVRQPARAHRTRHSAHHGGGAVPDGPAGSCAGRIVSGDPRLRPAPLLSAGRPLVPAAQPCSTAATTSALSRSWTATFVERSGTCTRTSTPRRHRRLGRGRSRGRPVSRPGRGPRPPSRTRGRPRPRPGPAVCRRAARTHRRRAQRPAAGRRRSLPRGCRPRPG